jgi:hypothetical protein
VESVLQSRQMIMDLGTGRIVRPGSDRLTLRGGLPGLGGDDDGHSNYIVRNRPSI